MFFALTATDTNNCGFVADFIYFALTFAKNHHILCLLDKRRMPGMRHSANAELPFGAVNQLIFKRFCRRFRKGKHDLQPQILPTTVVGISHLPFPLAFDFRCSLSQNFGVVGLVRWAFFRTYCSVRPWGFFVLFLSEAAGLAVSEMTSSSAFPGGRAYGRSSARSDRGIG